MSGFHCLNSFVLCRTMCQAGYYSLGSQKQCTQCPEGYMCPNIEQGPKLCGQGFYSTSGAVNCTGCEAGSYCPSTMGEFLSNDFRRLQYMILLSGYQSKQNLNVRIYISQFLIYLTFMTANFYLK